MPEREYVKRERAEKEAARLNKKGYKLVMITRQIRYVLRYHK